MKKTLLSLLLLIAATTMSGQTMLRGDMNGDGKLTLADLTALANVIVGKAPIEAINVYEVDNTTVIGTWYASDGTVLHFNEDGTTDYMGESTYEFMPFLASLLIYDATGSVVKTMKFKNVTPKYLLEESTINGALTYYTNSSYIVSDITLNQSTLSLNSGSTYQLRTTVAPVAALNSSVIWTSSDESVAMVNANGLVTAVAGGSCIITCKAADGGGASTSCEVTVIQMVTEITLSQTILILQPDDFQKLTATISPSNAVNNGVTWTSSDENVAEVTSTGGVVAIDWGVCTITCTAKDGSGVSAICHVKVFKQPEYVDLSLPSGTLWATWNVGASRPEEYGDCFAWGETTGLLYGKTTFSWDTYNLCNGSMATLTKYCNNSAYGNDGYSDTLMELEPEDDAAYVNWGSEWRMPSDDQFEELINSNNTTIDWTTQNDVNGIRITSNANGNSIFLPATGYRYEGSNGVGTSGNYWSRSLGTGNSNYSFDLCFSSDNRFMDYSKRCNGRSVRPVLNRVMSITLNEPILTMNPGTTAQLTATISPSSINSSMMWTSSDENVATVDADGQVTAVAGGNCIITCTAQDGSGKNATCEVSVVQLVTRIILSHSTLSLNVGTTSQLTSSVQPSDASNKNVTWTSSDGSVAEVTSNGSVVAIGIGVCAITCTAKDGSGVAVTCIVVVSEDTGPHEYVDLGLPSGTLWATCNIGANNSEEYGNYFAWGEVTPKTIYDWSTYKYCNGSETTMTKYCTDNSYGTVDNITELELYDDAAYVNWGSEWRMPSDVQFEELINSSYTWTTWTTQNNVNGVKITSKSNNKSIFLPAAGEYYQKSQQVGSYLRYWTRTLSTTTSYVNCGAYGLRYVPLLDLAQWYRYTGWSIRPVRNSVGN